MSLSKNRYSIPGQASGTCARDVCARSEAMSNPANKGEIFVVDDDPAIHQVLSLLFARAGYQLVCFAEGGALLATARSQTPICIILDVHIPGRSGLDILKQLEAEEYPAPIFVISGKGDIAMAVDAIKHGALDFI